MAPKVSVSNLYKVFGSPPEEALRLLAEGRSKEEILSGTGMTVGVQDVSFSVDAGEIFVVMGLSGSGKSTLVRMLNRLIEPTAGEILIDGTDMASADARSEEHTSELQSLMRNSYAVFCLKKTKQSP